MTNLTRSSTLSLRRTAAEALTPSRTNTAVAATAESSAARAGATAELSAAQRVIRSDALLQGRSHISITHNGETYQLRATRLGKLILTK